MNVVVYFNDITDAFILNEGQVASIEEPKCYVKFSEWIEKELIPHERESEDEDCNVTYVLSIRDYLKYLKNHI